MNKIFAVMVLAGLLAFGCVGPSALTEGAASGAIESASRSYWASVSPFAITAWKYSGTELDLTIQQNGGQDLVLTGITGSSGLSYAQNITLAYGKTKTIAITGMADCGASGATFDIANVQIVYNQGGITGLHEIGVKDIVGTCS